MNNRAGEFLRANSVMIDFANRGRRGEDVSIGLKEALARGWIVEGANNGLGLTESGFAEM